MAPDPLWKGPLSAVAAAMLVATLLPVATAAEPAPQSLAATLQAPGWAVGFSWTYRYVGPYYELIGVSGASFEASYVNDTYTSTVVGEASPAAGPSWVVRNDHAGTMQGNATVFTQRNAASATFTSVTYALVRKSDFAILNFTQDLNMTATGVPILGTTAGTGHNETNATPPYEQVAFGTAADGTPWHIATNLTSTGWFIIGSFPQQSTGGYQALDYNLSVTGVTNVTVPAGTFEVYNISGGGSANTDGSVRPFNQSFLWSPLVQNKVVDEGGYWLLDYDVNRPPELNGPLPALNITSGQGTDFDLTGYFSDPDGDAFTITCQAPAGLACSVGPGSTLNVTSGPGLNATLNLTLTVDDGRPAGRVSFPMLVLVTGPGSTNMPPVALPHGVLTTQEDVPFVWALADYFEDPDDGISYFQYYLQSPLNFTGGPAGTVTIRAPANASGDFAFRIVVYDFGGLSAESNFTLHVTPVNDPPTIAAVGPLGKTGHVGSNLTVSVTASDVDGDPLTYSWELDGAPFGTGATLSFGASLAGAGAHTLNATVSDGQGGSATLSYTLLVFTGPRIVGHGPSALAVTVGTGSSLRFNVTAVDEDSPGLDYRWSLNGAQFDAGPGHDNVSLPFADAGVFSVRATVADNGSNATVEWQVTVVAVPSGLIAIESPMAGPMVRVDEGKTLALRAAVDGNLTDVSIQWSIGGALVSTAPSFDWPVAHSGTYEVTLEGSGLYLGSVLYAGTDSVNVSVLIVVPPVPGGNNTNGTNGNGTNGTNNNGTNGTGGGGGGGPPSPTASDDSLVWLLLAVVAVAAAVAVAVWLRKRPG